MGMRRLRIEEDGLESKQVWHWLVGFVCKLKLANSYTELTTAQNILSI